VWVVILKQAIDLNIACTQHWYRIPVGQAEKLLRQYECGWPRWLAFYQPKVFGHEGLAVRYYAEVRHLQERSRQELFPTEVEAAQANKRYYQFLLAPLQQLPQPIPSARLRRISFIPTTLAQLMQAQEVSELMRF
jgi:hypothetical protein